MAKYMKVQKCDKGILPDRQLAVTNGEAARMLGVSARTLANWRAAGRGPRYARVGMDHSPVLYRICDIESWLASHPSDDSDGGHETSASARR